MLCDTRKEAKAARNERLGDAYYRFPENGRDGCCCSVNLVYLVISRGIRIGGRVLDIHYGLASLWTHQNTYTYKRESEKAVALHCAGAGGGNRPKHRRTGRCRRGGSTAKYSIYFLRMQAVQASCTKVNLNGKAEVSGCEAMMSRTCQRR